MPTLNHSPLRTCIGCMQRDLKSAMVRMAVRGTDVCADLDARLGGRGGYLHPHAACLRRFEASKVKEFRSLRRKVAPEERKKITQVIRARLDSGAALE
ncbi:MAG: YlxR family protein [Candidatus Binataceae bacterium]